MSNTKEVRMLSNNECEGENVRNQKISAKYCTAKQTVVGNTQELVKE